MSVNDRLRYGVDLVTFFHPKFWGVADYDGIAGIARENPRAFWDKVLDSVHASGVTGLEFSFAPFNWQDAVRAYGSLKSFVHELSRRGLEVASGFFGEPESMGDFTDPAAQSAILVKADRYAEFLNACGSDIMVIGAPLRYSRGVQPIRFHDFEQARKIADFLNRLGAILCTRGVRLALHTEAHTVFGNARDIDLMMMLTDPYYVYMCPDTAHITLAGSDPVQVVGRHLERMIITHWKDALGSMPADIPIDEHIHQLHRPYFCRLGLGKVDWPAWTRLLKGAGYDGWAILELDPPPNPVTDIATGLRLVSQGYDPIFH
jgi:sugar phosphate isomerase/epimerase